MGEHFLDIPAFHDAPVAVLPAVGANSAGLTLVGEL